MGCDYSKRTLHEFEKKTQEVDHSIESLKKQQEQLKSTIEHLHLPKEPTETIDSLKKSLIPHLERMEALLNEIKEAKAQSLRFNREKNSFEDAVKNKFQVSTKAESSEHLSRGGSPFSKREKEKEKEKEKGKDKHYILEDPTIKAMIEKNRVKFGIKKK